MSCRARLRRQCIAVALLFSLTRLAVAQNATVPSQTAVVHAQVNVLKVTILSTMLADEGIGEWGFSALVEADGHRFW